MGRETPIMSLGAGVAVFTVTVLVVSTLLAPVVSFSLLLALPIGIGNGTAAMTVVYVGMSDDPSGRHYRIAFALGALGVTFLGVLVAAMLSGETLLFGVYAGLAAGFVAAVGVYASLQWTA